MIKKVRHIVSDDPYELEETVCRAISTAESEGWEAHQIEYTAGRREPRNANSVQEYTCFIIFQKPDEK